MSDAREGPHVGPVMAFSPARRALASFYRDVIGMRGDDTDGTTWLDAANAQLAIGDPSDRDTPAEVRESRAFVVWFGVLDVRATFDRAKRIGATVGEFRGDYFFARDPDGRFIGIHALEDSHGHEHEH